MPEPSSQPYSQPNSQPASPDQTLNQRSIELHRRYRGKIQMMPKAPLHDPSDMGIWYTPGVAAVCREIVREPEAVFQLTNRGNMVAIVSDGSRVLGLGNIGPEAGLPVMEGKAYLFKYLGGVDAVPLCVRVNSVDELIQFVQAIAPSFGGVNLEDIAQPKCFRVLAALRDKLDIPVWHDDQQGTATVVLAALENAFRLTERTFARARITLIGTGAANVAVYRLLVAAGADPANIIACDRRGALHPGRGDLESQAEQFPEKWSICRESNALRVVAGPAECLVGADVCVAFSSSGPGVIHPEWITRMAPDPIVFACANPVPEIWPDQARRAGARIVATGRGDFPNQVNNSLAFPAIFRGALDVRARALTDGMALAAARELALAAQEQGLSDEHIVPSMSDWEVYPRVAAAVGERAILEGVAQRMLTRAELHDEALRTIRESRATFEWMTRNR